MEAILKNYIPKTAELILPYDETLLYRDLPREVVNAPFCDTESVTRAEALLGQPVPALPASLYREYYENGNRSHYEGPYFARRTALLTLTAAELTEGKGRFLDLIIDYLWAVCEETSWVIPAHNTPRHGKTDRLPDAFDLGEGDDIHYIDLFAAATSATLAHVIRLLGDRLDEVTPVVTRRVRGLIDRRIFHPFLNFDRSMWWKGVDGNSLNNWTPWIISNVLTTLLLLERDSEKRVKICAESMEILDRFIKFYNDDGGCDEGPGYWNVAGASYFDCLEVLYDLSGGKIDVFALPIVRRMGEYIADFHICGNIYVNFADASHRLGADATLIARIGRRTKSPKLISFASELLETRDIHQFGGGNGSTTYRAFRNMCEPAPETVETSPENRTYYDGLEVFLARDPDSGMFLAAKGGSNAESHNHNDVGNLVVFRKDKPVFIDAGVETYTKKTFSAQRYELWTMRSVYHNLPYIGGEEQKAGGQYKAVLVGKTNDSVTFDLSAAWDSGAGIRCVRTSAMTGDTVTITDTIAQGEEKPLMWYFLCAEKPVVDGRKLRFATAGVKMDITGIDVKATVEEVPLTDAKLKGEWKSDALYRLCLDVGIAKDAEAQFTVSPM